MRSCAIICSFFVKYGGDGDGDNGGDDGGDDDDDGLCHRWC